MGLGCFRSRGVGFRRQHDQRRLDDPQEPRPRAGGRPPVHVAHLQRRPQCGRRRRHPSQRRPGISGLYYKPMTIINDDSRVVNKLET
jgi:hypothetical protein